MRELRHTSVLEAPAALAYGWHARPGALQRLLPPWADVRLLRCEGIDPGDRVELELHQGPLVVRLQTQHLAHEPGLCFRDEQVAGPFTRWRHTHRFHPLGPSRCLVEDLVHYDLPFGEVGDLLGGLVIHQALQRAFRFRHRRLADDLARHRRFAGCGPRTVAITGASGMVGQPLVSFLSAGGHRVRRMVRGVAATASERTWSVEDGVSSGALRGVDAVVHLAGEPMDGRWNARKRESMHHSRVEGTRALARSIAAMDEPPAVLVCASTTGFYGDREEELLDERSAPGQGYLAELARDWEEATEPARSAGVRVVHLRLGVVLAPRQGTLERMLTPYWLGFGGPLGDGRQWVPWVDLDDVVGAIHFALLDEALAGPVNVCAPVAVRNEELARVLGEVLDRPGGLRVPETVVRAAWGTMADQVLLSSARVRPSRLLERGFRFRHPDLEPSLRLMLGREADEETLRALPLADGPVARS